MQFYERIDLSFSAAPQQQIQMRPIIGNQKCRHLKICTSYLLSGTSLKPSCAAQAVTQGSLHNNVSVRSGRCCEIALEDIG
jgi:hypothetical protein